MKAHFDKLSYASNNSDDNNDVDWEKILVEEGMPSEITPDEEVSSGDSLETGDPSEAEKRREQADNEEETDKNFDDKE